LHLNLRRRKQKLPRAHRSLGFRPDCLSTNSSRKRRSATTSNKRATVAVAIALAVVLAVTIAVVVAVVVAVAMVRVESPIIFRGPELVSVSVSLLREDGLAFPCGAVQESRRRCICTIRMSRGGGRGRGGDSSRVFSFTVFLVVYIVVFLVLIIAVKRELVLRLRSLVIP
jgi:hypothetical protein